jgi:hypothetical protein
MSHGLGEAKESESIKKMVENEKCDAKVSIINYIVFREIIPCNHDYCPTFDPNLCLTWFLEWIRHLKPSHVDYVKRQDPNRSERGSEMKSATRKYF